MQSGSEALRLVKDRFPGQDEYIESLFSRDEHFIELCLDYILCRQSLERFIENEDERKSWMHEYGSLLSDLEKELAYHLAKAESPA